MARTLTGNTPQREQRIQSLMLDRLSLRYEKRIQREITRAMKEAGKNQNDIDRTLKKHRTNLDVILTALWNESALEMINHIITPTKALSDVEPTTIQDTVIRDWILKFGAELIVDISTTTGDDIKRIVSGGIVDGLSVREISSQIAAVAPSVGAARAQTIARTETHGAANLAGKATAEAAGVKMRREWVASGGNRTRKTHQDADGQTVGMDEPFTVGGVKLMYPGDSSAGKPSETINCRCAVAYVTIR
jgi:uncharacterized protein with gpF-like domain